MAVINGPTIAAGASLSDQIDISNGQVVAIMTPDDWTPANMSFQVAFVSGGPFHNLYDITYGGEVLVTCIPGSCSLVHVDTMPKNTFFKFRSGTAANPVPQVAERKFQVLIV